MRLIFSLLLFLTTLIINSQCNINYKEFSKLASIYKANTEYLIVVNFKNPSNSDRMFIINTKLNKVIYSCWCAHGFGGGSTNSIPVFSNTMGSNCSSLGWFLIDRSVGISATYGYKYHAVDGLSSTNYNARKRQILIHPWESVSRDEYLKISKPMNCDGRSAGCFTISDSSFKLVSNLIKNCNNRILLYAYY